MFRVACGCCETKEFRSWSEEGFDMVLYSYVHITTRESEMGHDSIKHSHVDVHPPDQLRARGSFLSAPSLALLYRVPYLRGRMDRS
jgi:hypothetical protein